MSAHLSPDELQALMGAIQDGKVPAGADGDPAGPVARYDLISPDRIIRGRMPTLDAISEQIAGQLTMGLAGRTRTSLQVASAPATLLQFADIAPLLAPPATVAMLSLGADYGFGLVLLEPGLARGLLAAALGDRRTRASEAAAEAPRELSPLEQTVLKRLLSVLTDAMAAAWAPVIPFRPEVLGLELGHRLAGIAPHDDVAIVVAFEFTGAIPGRLQLILPYAAVESAKARLAAPRHRAPRGRSGRSLLGDELEQVEVELRGILGQTVISFSRLMDLQQGELLLLDTDESRALPICVQGREKLSGRPSVSGGAIAMVVETPVGDLRPPPHPNHPTPARSEPQ